MEIKGENSDFGFWILDFGSRFSAMVKVMPDELARR